MATVDISKLEDALVIHFAAEGRRINAYTLASTLVAIADAAKAANASLNPGCEIEVVVEAVGPGSFRARIRALYKKHKGVLSNQVIAGVVIGVLGNYIYERTLAVDDTVILERSKRKWEFMWRGIKISAPVTDEKFYIDFFAHDITIAPGDILQVTLHVHQTRDPATGIYKNTRYEVAQVHSHTPRPKQLRLPDATV